MLIFGLVFVGWMFCSVVSVAFSSSKEGVVAVMPAWKFFWGHLIGMATGGFRGKYVYLDIGE